MEMLDILLRLATAALVGIFLDSTAICTESRQGSAHSDWSDWALPWRLQHLVTPTSLMQVAWFKALSPALGFWAGVSSFAVTGATTYTG